MTPLEQLEKEAREEFELAIENAPDKTLDGDTLQAVLDSVIAKAFLAGEKSGKNQAVDYLIEHSLRTVQGKTTTLQMESSILEKARTS